MAGMIEDIKFYPEKSYCFITYVEPASAQEVYQRYSQKKLWIDKYDCRIGWGDPSVIDPKLFKSVISGASRNVFISNLEPYMTAPWLEKEFGRFGEVEVVKILDDRRIAFIHMTSIASAIKAVNILKEDPQYANKRVNFGRDRCGSLQGVYERPDDDDEEVEQQVHDNRCIYIGGIKEGVCYRQIFDVKYFNFRAFMGVCYKTSNTFQTVTWPLQHLLTLVLLPSFTKDTTPRILFVLEVKKSRLAGENHFLSQILYEMP
jgi:RNA recognition motif-containing protein